jgi:hypothetical protein
MKRSCKSPLENHIHYIDKKIRHLSRINFDEVVSSKLPNPVLDNSSGLASFLVDQRTGTKKQTGKKHQAQPGLCAHRWTKAFLDQWKCARS